MSSISPVTRICVTTTPLCPIAAFSLVNVAGVRDGQKIFDPYAGSCAILLAVAMIAPTCQTVGVDIAHDGLINRENIRKDFDTRKLTQPKAVFRGDSTLASVRDQAMASVGDGPVSARKVCCCFSHNRVTLILTTPVFTNLSLIISSLTRPMGYASDKMRTLHHL